jgi:type IV secretion system protein VirB5
MTPEARAIRQAAGGVYNCSGIPTARDRVLCQARGAMPYQIQALLDGALSIATSKQLQVNALITAINATQDPKSIGELQARIAGEQAALANEQARVQMLAEVARNQAAIEHAQRNEATLRMFTLPVLPAGVVATEP